MSIKLKHESKYIIIGNHKGNKMHNCINSHNDLILNNEFKKGI